MALHAGHRARALESPQPRRYLQAVARWNVERSRRVEQPRRYLFPQAWKAEWHAGGAAEAACVAAGAVFAGRPRVDQRDAVPALLQMARAAEADDAGADDDGVRHQRMPPTVMCG